MEIGRPYSSQPSKLSLQPGALESRPAQSRHSLTDMAALARQLQPSPTTAETRGITFRPVAYVDSLTRNFGTPVKVRPTSAAQNWECRTCMAETTSFAVPGEKTSAPCKTIIVRFFLFCAFVVQTIYLLIICHHMFSC
jgi:hypothetical protein